MQYAFIQVSPNNALNDQNSNMSTTLTGLTANSPYTITFYTGTRNGYSQTSSLTVYVNGAGRLLQLSRCTDASGWQPAVTSAFTSPSSSATLVFAVSESASVNSDGVVLIDALSIGAAPALHQLELHPPSVHRSGRQLRVALVAGQRQLPVQPAAERAAAVELDCVPWAASPRPAATFDPPYPGTPHDAPPSPAQYAFLQTSAGGLAGYRLSATCRPLWPA